MAIDMDRLLWEAFFSSEITNASEALGRARIRFTDIYNRPGISFEVVAPPNPDTEWIRNHLVRPLVYHCQSTGIPVPDCPGMFVALFVGSRLHCIAAYRVVAWAAHILRESPHDWLARFGTQESETALR